MEELEEVKIESDGFNEYKVEELIEFDRERAVVKDSCKEGYEKR